MKTHRFTSHTPEEQRWLSNLGHWIEGLVLAAVGLLALLNSLAGISWTAQAWPVFLLATGGLLLLLLYPRHPRVDWPVIWNDPQQRQHTIMAIAVAVAGAMELAGWRWVWPLAAILVGVLFLTHTQHGRSEAVSRAVWIHRLLGITLILAGLLRLAEVATDSALLARLWPFALLAAAAQLLLYREPKGAFEGHSDHSSYT